MPRHRIALLPLLVIFVLTASPIARAQAQPTSQPTQPRRAPTSHVAAPASRAVQPASRPGLKRQPTPRPRPTPKRRPIAATDDGEDPPPAPAYSAPAYPAPAYRAPPRRETGAAAPQQSKSLRLQRGTWSFGGTIGLSIHLHGALEEQAQGFAAGPGGLGYTLSVSPTAGVFLSDSFELVFGANLRFRFGEYYERSIFQDQIEGSLGFRSYFGTSRRVIPYGGLHAHFGMVLLQTPQTFLGGGDRDEVSGLLGASLEVGILLALNSWVALRFSVSGQFAHIFGDWTEDTLLEFAPGFGVRAFF
jgi:hypothetical protein